MSAVARIVALWLALVTLAVAPARAVEPGERLSDPAHEARARKLSGELRCLVCQNQSIDDSNAPLARDLRILVREQIAAGRSDAQVLSYVVERYGAFVLLRPPVGVSTLLLWLAPILVLGSAAVFLVRASRRQPQFEPVPELTAEERRRLDELTKTSN